MHSLKNIAEVYESYGLTRPQKVYDAKQIDEVMDFYRNFELFKEMDLDDLLVLGRLTCFR